ncbi:MAG TPA: CsbD family protein [Acidimicrobiia bacterium]
MDGVEGKKDELKGRAKEAAGDLTENEDLKAEGKTDKAGGKIKQGLEDAKNKGEELVDKVKGKMQGR